MYDAKLIVTAFDSFAVFALLQSSLHWEWSILYGTTLRLDMSYTPTTNFETFPFPESLDRLETLGAEYYEHRLAVMCSQSEGLTKTYNRFHDPEETDTGILKLRHMHVDMDNAVAEAYGWANLDLGHGFHEVEPTVKLIMDDGGMDSVTDELPVAPESNAVENDDEGMVEGDEE